MVAGGAFLAAIYGFAPLVTALSQANLALLALAAGVGAVTQVVRARRAAVLLSQRGGVRTSDAYHAMVVGHGFGDLVPVVPCGVALRCVLTERLSSVALAYSSGVFMLEGMLDGLGPAVLTGFLLLTLQFPTWLRLLLIFALCQSLLFLAVPLLAYLLRRSGRRLVLPVWMTRWNALGGHVADGLVSGLSGGVRNLLFIAGISLVITALGGIQLVLFLAAFGLATSPGNVLLILVLTLAAGSLPIKIPGSGTVATVVVLHVAGVQGVGVAAFVLLSRVVLSTETTLLACGSLAWWSATGRVHDLRVGAALHTLSQARWQAVLRRARSTGQRIGWLIAAPMKVLGARRISSGGLVIAVGLLGFVALSEPVFNRVTRLEATAGSVPIHRSTSAAATVRTMHTDGTRDALNAYLRDMPDSLRDALALTAPRDRDRMKR